jgi:hypothetical protein
VLWKGFPASEATWEPLSHLKGVMDLVRAFEASTACTTPSSTAGAWLVESIVGKRTRRGKTEYCVLWKGFPASEATWEPLSHLKGVMDLVRVFESKVGQNCNSQTPKKTGARPESAGDPLVGARVEKQFGNTLYGGQSSSPSASCGNLY